MLAAMSRTATSFGATVFIREWTPLTETCIAIRDLGIEPSGSGIKLLACFLEGGMPPQIPRSLKLNSLGWHRGKKLSFYGCA